MAVIVASAVLAPPTSIFPPGSNNPELARETPYSISALVQVTAGGGQFFVGYGLTPFAGLSSIDLKIRGALWQYLRTVKDIYFGSGAALGLPNGLIASAYMLFQSSPTSVPPPSFVGGLIPGDPRPAPDTDSNILAWDFGDPGPATQLWFISARRPHSSGGI